MDNISEERLDLVEPRLAAKIRQMADMLQEEAIHLRVTQGLRSWKEQDRLYQQGRTTPGIIVTNAEPGRSWHNYGMSVDVVPIYGDMADWNEEHPVWKRLIAIGDSLGLEHVNLKTRNGFHRDWPHFQLTGKYPASPTDEVRQVYINEGMLALWNEAFKGEA